MKRVAVSVMLAVGLTTPAAAHRLDEYLQATLIGVTRGGVDIEISLTPGVAVLPAVMAAIDRNHDGLISPEEERAYTGDVGHDVALQVDGKSAPLRLTMSQFPSVQAMQEGLGTIRLNFRTDHSGRELRFENRHMPQVSVYLVNLLESKDKGLAIGKPERDPAQRSIQVAYSFADARGTSWAAGWRAQGVLWLAVFGVLLLIRLGLRRRERRFGAKTKEVLTGKVS